jgi:hypothetical protein
MLELGLSAQRIYQDLVAGHGFAVNYSRQKLLVLQPELFGMLFATRPHAPM